MQRTVPPRFEQKGDSLSQWHDKIAKQYGKAKAQRMVSQLEVTKSMRRYNSLKRAMPNTIFRYQGKSFVLRSLLSKGLYYRTFGQGKKKAWSYCTQASNEYLAGIG